MSLVAGAMVLVYGLSFFLCADEQCLSGNCDGDCDALICLWTHGSSCAVHLSIGSTHDNCNCVCHVPTIPASRLPSATLSDVGTSVQFEYSEYSSLAPSPVFHPPLAA